MITESVFYALSLVLILSLGLVYTITLRRYLRFPIPVVLLMNVAIYALLYFFVPPFVSISGGRPVLVMMPVLALFYLFCHRITDIDAIRSSVLFLWAGGLTSFASAFTQALEFGLGLDVYSLKLQIIRIVISLSILVFIVLFTFKWDDKFITEPNVPNQLWLSFAAIPVIFFYLNITLISYTPDMISGTRQLYTYSLIMVGNFVMYILLTSVFYSNAMLYIESAKVSEEKRLLEIQTSQYANITRDVKRTHKLHHDLKHTLNTIKEMAKEDGSERILTYLESLNSFIVDMPTKNYTGHAALNSILNHYALRAASENVPLNLQVDIPDTLPMADPEICSLIGNLMENAIDASRLIPEKERSFSLSIVLSDSNLIIVSTNNFNGKVKKVGDKYLSTKHSGYGIGIRSVMETAEHYGGTMRVNYEKKKFFIDIMLNFD